MKISIIVPLLDEAGSLRELHRQVTEVCAANDIDAEILFIDDGSRDASWKVVCELADEDPRVSGIRFRRNFGKAAALTAGMRAAIGDVIVTLDADLQDDPTEIPRFLEKLAEGHDVVNGWKERRLDPWHKTKPSKVFNWMVGALTGLRLHDHNCGFKAFRRDVACEIRIYGELHRYIPVLAHARGFRVTEIPVNHRERRHGHSKYGVRRFLRGFLDLLTVKFLTGFGQRPQHVLGGIGVGFFLLGALGLAYLAITWLLMNVPPMVGAEFVTPRPIGDRPLLAYSVAFTLLGAQALSLGLLAEMLVAYTGRDVDTYSVRERAGERWEERELRVES
ncbi:MAG: glycosyltransferase family 2 protein [Planctomycetaceae bacterium]